MMKPIAIAVIGLCVAAAPSFAQSASPKSAAECQQLWTTADANKDNMLDMAELQANKAQMPSSLMNGSSASTTGSTTGTTGSSDTTASTTGTTGTTGSSDTTASTTGSTGNASGSATGSTTGMMVSQQDFMTACTTGQ